MDGEPFEVIYDKANDIMIYDEIVFSRPVSVGVHEHDLGDPIYSSFPCQANYYEQFCACGYGVWTELELVPHQYSNSQCLVCSHECFHFNGFVPSSGEFSTHICQYCLSEFEHVFVENSDGTFTCVECFVTTIDDNLTNETPAV